MTVQRMQFVLWAFFVVMSIAAIPIAMAGFGSIEPHGLGVAVGVGALVAWWASFGYAMYLAMVAVKNGDRRLLKRGVRGTATITSAKMTGETIQTGGYDWEGDRVYKYGLHVSLPGNKEYDTSCSICSSGLQVGQVVPVAASRFNPARVTIDLGQGKTKGTVPDAPVTYGLAAAGGTFGGVDPLADPAMADVKHLVDGMRANLAKGVDPTSGLHLGHARVIVNGQEVTGLGSVGATAGGAAVGGEAARLAALSKLAELHDAGTLSDAEFATEKARILGS